MTIKQKIIQGALQQFLTHGIRKMTMQKLVEAMGLSTKTVYKYFTDKEDLLQLWAEHGEVAAGRAGKVETGWSRCETRLIRSEEDTDQ